MELVYNPRVGKHANTTNMEPENMYAAPKVGKHAIGNMGGKTCSLHKVQEKFIRHQKGETYNR